MVLAFSLVLAVLSLAALASHIPPGLIGTRRFPIRLHHFLLLRCLLIALAVFSLRSHSE